MLRFEIGRHIAQWSSEAGAPLLAALLQPYIRIANALPRVVLAPMFLLWFGLGIWSKVALGVTVVFFIVVFECVES